ncbi:MAG: cyclic pyranopterin monophosphate synthase MoaC [Spirochaetaceae bacterium]|jgi:cyclic pyranopterin phosphate synthase|nr:cyclic pyranopterin monophosphate synthase MoaC [Spirochaetaceae bacterium]
MEEALNHFDEAGNAVMVDISEKQITEREAAASGIIFMKPQTLSIIKTGTAKKGDVLGVARVAGIMAAKKTSFIIPLCHPVSFEKCAVDFSFPNDESNSGAMVEARCTIKLTGKTGAEMEALTGVTAALLTIYDMCKAVDRGMTLSEIKLEEKSGGKSGHYIRPQNSPRRV